jgi:hypothetical protein
MRNSQDKVESSGAIKKSTMHERVKLIASAMLWLLIIGIGLYVLWNYENTPGISAQAPAQWPTESQIQPDRNQATLVMLAHPHCSCTRASIGELAWIMAHGQRRVTGYVLFLRPTGFSDDWEQTDLRRSAAAIPGVKVILDDDGKEARIFHASTSGQTVLYDANGRLPFSGGITGSRGHSADNAGRTAIFSLLNQGVSDRTETFVFGCPLFDQNSGCHEKKK